MSGHLLDADFIATGAKPAVPQNCTKSSHVLFDIRATTRHFPSHTSGWFFWCVTIFTYCENIFRSEVGWNLNFHTSCRFASKILFLLMQRQRCSNTPTLIHCNNYTTQFTNLKNKHINKYMQQHKYATTQICNNTCQSAPTFLGHANAIFCECNFLLVKCTLSSWSWIWGGRTEN